MIEGGRLRLYCLSLVRGMGYEGMEGRGLDCRRGVTEFLIVGGCIVALGAGWWLANFVEGIIRAILKPLVNLL